MEVSQLDIDQILVPQGTETLILDTYRNTNSVFFVHNNVKKLPSKVAQEDALEKLQKFSACLHCPNDPFPAESKPLNALLSLLT